MNPQIQALYELQQRDRQLFVLERKLTLIPQRLDELEEDLGKLQAMLDAERTKCDHTREFQRGQEQQLEEEEEMLRNSRAKMQAVKSPRELSALQREIESTRRMSAARGEEINKIKEAVADAEQKIDQMAESFADIKAKGEAETTRLRTAKDKLAAKLERLQSGRTELTDQIDVGTRRTYDRIRKRLKGLAFVAAHEGRCTACKIHVPHQQYVALRKGDEIISCESCGRLLFWGPHFKESEEEIAKRNEAKPKQSPPQRRATPKE